MACPLLRMEWFQDLKVCKTEYKAFVKRKKVKRKQEWESHKVALGKVKKSKEQQYHQQSQEERGAIYAQMLQNLERTRAAVRSSISKASTISDEECRLALTEDNFLSIQWKMDRINQKLIDLYGNWQAEYRNAVTSEDCEEVKRFYKPYLEKYKSKYRILYQMLQRPIDRWVRLVYFLSKNLLLKLLLV